MTSDNALEYYGSAYQGERAPEIPVTKSVRVNWWTPKQPRDYVAQ